MSSDTVDQRQIKRRAAAARLTWLKRAAGCPKDLEVIAELQALLEERRNLDRSAIG